jgi:hypothetical protein
VNASFQGQGARHRLCGLGSNHRWHGRGWSGPGWLASHRLLLALGVHDQLAAWYPDFDWTLVFVPESKAPQRAGGIDLVGAVLSVIMFATLVFGLIEGRIYGWWEVNPNRQFELFGFVWPETGLSPIPVALQSRW